MNTEFCVMCHNPNATDEAQRPADKGVPVSIEFDYLIHSLHTGEKRTQFTGCVSFWRFEPNRVE